MRDKPVQYCQLDVLTQLPRRITSFAARVRVISGFWNVDGRAAVAVPLMPSRTSCGFSSPTDDHIDKVLDFNDLLIQHPAATYVVRATGDCIDNVGIYDGSYVVVDRSIDLRDGAIIVAVLDGDFTIRTNRRDGGRAWLQTENPRYQDIEITDAAGFEFWGTATNCIRGLTRLGKKK